MATQSPWERSQASFPSSHCLDQTRSPSVVITADAISPAHRVSDCYSVEGDQLPSANVSRDLLTWMPSYPQRSKGRRFPGSSLGGRICLKKPELLRYQMQKLITTVQNFGSTRFSPECSSLKSWRSLAWGRPSPGRGEVCPHPDTNPLVLLILRHCKSRVNLWGGQCQRATGHILCPATSLWR